MFCPNCGTKNDDTAMPCTKCGFKLSGASAAKFRGTMMLNADQSVQDMVEEHRRKLAEEGNAHTSADGPVSPAPGGTHALGSAPGSTKDPLQPPRAGAPKRRMGTMLGVAPQGGEVRPPQTPTPPPAGAEHSPPSAPDPLGGTIAFAGMQPVPAPPAHPLAAGRTEASAAVASSEALLPAPHPLSAGRTEAFAAVPVVASAPAAQPALAAGRTQAVASVPETAAGSSAAPALAGRSEAFDAPPAAHEQGLARAAEERDSLAPAAGLPQRLRPLDVFLIVITFGLYGLVIWARQRKSS